MLHPRWRCMLVFPLPSLFIFSLLFIQQQHEHEDTTENTKDRLHHIQNIYLGIHGRSPSSHNTTTNWTSGLKRARFERDMPAERARESLSRPVVISVVSPSLVERLGAPSPPPAPPIRATDFILPEGFKSKNRSWRSSQRQDPCFLQLSSPELLIELNCSLVDGDQNSHDQSDALWVDLISLDRPTQLKRWNKNQAIVGFTQESPLNFPNQIDPALLPHMDLLMSHELDADVVAMYYWDRPEFHQPPKVSWEKKEDAVGFVSRNCAAINNRVEIVTALSKHYSVDSYGCLKLGKHIGSKDDRFVDKIEMYRGLKFCVAIENSNFRDYVSEKIWEAFEAGCLPIYMGAPNIVQDFLPLPNAAIVYDPATSTPEKLAKELKRLSRNKTAYDATMAWRTMPFEKLSPGYQRLVTLWRKRPKPLCQLCQQAALWRMAKEQEDADPGSVLFTPREARGDQFETIKREQVSNLVKIAQQMMRDREKERGS